MSVAVADRTSESNWRTRAAARRGLPRSHKLQASGRASLRHRHPDEGSSARWLLAEAEADVPVITRPRGGSCWSAVGTSLRVIADRPCGAGSPTLMNDEWDCSDLNSAFPHHCAIGARTLQSGLVNRLVFEMRGDAAMCPRIVQVGIAQIGGTSRPGTESGLERGQLSNTTPLLSSVVCTSAGDFQTAGIVGSLDVVSPRLTQRYGDWASGAPTWLVGGIAQATRVLLEVDLRRGVVSVRLGEWSAEPAVIAVPGLRPKVAQTTPLKAPRASQLDSGHLCGTPDQSPDDADRPWLPFVSLTAIGQEAKILDFHICTDL